MEIALESISNCYRRLGGDYGQKFNSMLAALIASICQLYGGTLYKDTRLSELTPAFSAFTLLSLVS